MSLIQPVRGKQFTARLTYTQPVPMADVEEVDSCEKVCEAEDSQGDTYVDYTVECTDGLRVARQITWSDWNASCKGENEIIMETIVNMLDGLIPRVAQKQAEEMNPLIGNWSSFVDPTWLTVDEFLEVETKYSGGTNNPQWFERVNAAKVQTRFCGPTLITGGVDLWTAWRLLNVGCCTNDGIDALALLRTYGEAVVYDPFIATEFGNNVSLMIQSQSIQLLNPVYNTAPVSLGSFADLDMTYRNGWMGVIRDPESGILVDLNVKEDCGVIHIVMTATTKTVGLPNDLVDPTHNMSGVNFVTGISVDNP